MMVDGRTAPNLRSDIHTMGVKDGLRLGSMVSRLRRGEFRIDGGMMTRKDME
jgi:hypothetical protein